MRQFRDDAFVIMVTKGVIKKNRAEPVLQPLSGLIACLDEGDDMVAAVSTGNNHVFLVSRSGMSIRFPKTTCSWSRARGRGMDFDGDDSS